VGEGLDGLITWCVPLRTLRSVCSHLGLFSPLHSSFPEFSSLFLFSLSCEFDCYWIDRGYLQYVTSAAARITW